MFGPMNFVVVQCCIKGALGVLPTVLGPTTCKIWALAAAEQQQKYIPNLLMLK